MDGETSCAAWLMVYGARHVDVIWCWYILNSICVCLNLLFERRPATVEAVCVIYPVCIFALSGDPSSSDTRASTVTQWCTGLAIQ